MGSLRVTRVLSAVTSVLGSALLLSGCGGGTASSTPSHAAKPPASASAATSLASLPPAQILSKALAAAEAAGPVHFTEIQRSDSGTSTYDQNASSGAGNQVIRNAGGTVTVRVVAGVGYFRATATALAQLFPGKAVSQLAGRQVTTGGNGAEMTELVLPGGTYIHGNEAALTGFLGMRARKAARLANRWLVLHAGDPDYQQITQGVTGDSVLSSVTPTGRLVKAKKVQKISGQSVIGVGGTAPASSDAPPGADAELWVAATGKPLPVAALEVSGSNRIEVYFIRSSWGEKVTGVTAPAGAVPYPAG